MTPLGNGDGPAWETHMGIEQQPSEKLARCENIVRFTRKPAKSGVNYIIWIPRALVREGIVDPDAEYEVYLQRRSKER